jgi:hypothetical protein
VSDERRDGRHRDERGRDGRHHDETPAAGTDGRRRTPESGSVGRYGPFEQPTDAGPEVVYEEFSCEDHLLATVFDTERSDRWIQTTLVVPIEE